MTSKTTFNQYWIKHFSRFFGGSEKAFVNPIRKVGVAFFAFEALDELGVNQWHPTNVIICHVKELMGSVVTKDGNTCWDAFCSRARKRDSDVSQKLLKIVISLQTSYGERLREQNSCIDVQRTDSDIYLRLNTSSTNPLKRRANVKRESQEHKPSFWSRFSARF